MTSESNRLLLRNNYSFLFAVLLDGITLSLIFPLLNDLLIAKETSILSSDYTSYDRELVYSLVLFVYMSCWAWGNALVSSLSDIYGRKPALIFSMLGKIAGFTLLLISVLYGSVSLLILSRIIDGLTNGIQPEAEAVGIDLSPSKGLRPAYIGYLLLPVALGDTVGSFVLAYVKDFSWLGADVRLRPIHFGLGISIVALVLIIVQFKETFTRAEKRKVDLLYPLKIFGEALHQPEIRVLGGIFLLSVIGWSLFFNYLDSFAMARFHFAQHRLDLLMAMPGLAFVLAWTFFVRLFNKLTTPATVFMIAKVIAAVLIVLTSLTGSQNVLFGLVFLAALFNSTAYASILALFANATQAEKQGWVMGIAGALHFLAFGLSGLLASALLKFSFDVLFSVSAMIIALSVSLMFVYKRNKEKPI
jgi:MFS family permease